MPDVNLLPKEQRDRERKEQELLKKAPRKVEIALTNPPKDPKTPALPRAHLPKPSIWERLFGPPTKPKHPLPPKPPAAMAPSPSLLPKEPATGVQPLIHTPKQSWWGKLWAPKSVAAKPKALTPPASAPLKPEPRATPVAPDLLHGVSQPSTSVFVLPSQPVSKPPPTAAPPKAPTPPMPIRSVSPPPSVVISGTMSAPHPPPPKGPIKLTKPEKEREPEKKTAPKDSVTLLPEEFRPREAQIETKLVATVLGSVIVAAAIVAAGLFVLDLFKLAADSDLETMRRSADDIIRSINQKSDVRAKGEELQRKMAVAGSLLDRHLYWTKWLGVLEERTNVDVQWAQMEADAQKRAVELQGVGRSLTAVAQQIMAWRGTPAVESVVVTSASSGGPKSGRKTSEGEIPAFSFSATITLKQQYEQIMPDPMDPAKTIAVTRGVITTTRQEAEVDLKGLFESAP